MIIIEHHNDNQRIVVRASGTLTAADYDEALPELDHAIELSEGPLQVMIRLEDFAGWELPAFWKEIELTLTRTSELGRVAIVGGSTMEEWGAKLADMVTGTPIAFFPAEREDEALRWLNEG